MVITKITETEKAKLKVCAYVRVSTDHKEQETSLIAQKSYWEKKLSQNSDFEYIGLYADEGISGKSMKNRKQFNEMLDLARKKEIDHIYTKSISRFARNFVETTEIVRELRNIGIAVIFEKENLNTLDPKCGLVLSVMASLAEEELRSMSKNQQWAARKRFASGSIELTKILGYDYAGGQLIVNHGEAKIIKLIYELYLKGNGVLKIARRLDELGYRPLRGGEKWSKSTVLGILTNEKYIGDCLLQKNIYNQNERKRNNGELPKYYIKNSHEAIISREDFENVQKRMAEISAKYHLSKMTSAVYPLSGKIKCGNCGTTYTRKTCAKGKTYECIKWTCGLKNSHTNAACDSNDIKNDVIEELLIAAYNESLGYRFSCITGMADAEQKVKQLLCAEQDLKQMKVRGYITEPQFQMESKQLLEEIRKCEESVNQLKNSNIYMSKYERSAVFTKDMADFLVEATIKDWMVTFRFANEYETTKKYTNGRAGNVNGKLCKHQT